MVAMTMPSAYHFMAPHHQNNTLERLYIGEEPVSQYLGIQPYVNVHFSIGSLLYFFDIRGFYWGWGVLAICRILANKRMHLLTQF